MKEHAEAPGLAPRQNRVAPTGELLAVAERGGLTGNRGVLHDASGRIVRQWQVRRWITCLLAFRERHREVMAPNRYTHLFFVDEATAFAAGHRPCAECRRADHVAFRARWPGGGAPSADAMDAVLHRERTPVGGRRPLWTAAARDLPDGAFVVVDDEPWMLRGGRLHLWSPAGYLDDRPAPGGGALAVLTPPSTVEVLRAGYPLTTWTPAPRSAG